MHFWRPLAVAIAACALATAAAAKPFLYVENSGSGDISVISIPDHEVVSRIHVGGEPDDVVGSADGKTVFVNVSIANDNKLGVREAGEIVAISTETDKILWRLPINQGWPHHLSISKAGLLYVPLFDRAHVLVIDTKVHKVVGHLDGMWGMHTTRLSPDDSRLYAGSMLTQSIYVLDVKTNKPVKILSFRDGVRPFTFTHDEKTLYAQLSRLHGFVVADLQKGEVTRTVRLPELPADFEYPIEWPHNVDHGLELSPDEAYLFAAGSAADYVAVYTQPELKLVKTIPVGRDPNWIAFSPDGRFAYVGCRAEGEVSVISVAELREIKRLKTGGEGSARLHIVDVPSRRANAAR